MHKMKIQTELINIITPKKASCTNFLTWRPCFPPKHYKEKAQYRKGCIMGQYHSPLTMAEDAAYCIY